MNKPETQPDGSPNPVGAGRRLVSLSMFLAELKAHGEITWGFDEQQADPIHRYWRDMISDWRKALDGISANSTPFTKQPPGA